MKTNRCCMRIMFLTSCCAERGLVITNYVRNCFYQYLTRGFPACYPSLLLLLLEDGRQCGMLFAIWQSIRLAKITK
uniref:Putative secreted protein n=1 Tax=Anopheles darlingi TaxID=43151 RepID=A0A2M4D3R0_ANODA